LFVAIAYAAEGGAGASQSPFGAFVPLILIFAIFYFLLIRPQQKKAKEHTSSLETMKTGDEVLTSGGMFGKVSKIDGDRVVVEIADKVKVTIAKSQLHPQKSVEKKS
jgi:preprotein translocase subunit YajC